MSNDTKATTTTSHPKRWRRILLICTVLGVVLWWLGVRVFYFVWITAHGTEPARHTDFSLLTRVLPPADATLDVIYRGLPHQMWASGGLWRDLFTTRHRAIAGYRFYSEPIVASADQRGSMAAALQSTALYLPYRGAKLCGGYHPDYCFEWHSSRGTFYALLCAGCHEIILTGDGAEVHCDLKDAPAKELEKLINEFK